MSATVWNEVAGFSTILIAQTLRRAELASGGRLTPRVNHRSYRYPMGGHLPEKIRAGAQIQTSRDGFTITWAGETGSLMRFMHFGRAGQVPRPFVGLKDTELADRAQFIVDDLIEDGRKLGIFK